MSTEIVDFPVCCCQSHAFNLILEKLRSSLSVGSERGANRVGEPRVYGNVEDTELRRRLKEALPPSKSEKIQW